jgi:hypothetical protein
MKLVDQKKRNVMQWTNIWTPKKVLTGLVILLQTIPLI